MALLHVHPCIVSPASGNSLARRPPSVMKTSSHLQVPTLHVCCYQGMALPRALPLHLHSAHVPLMLSPESSRHMGVWGVRTCRWMAARLFQASPLSGCCCAQRLKAWSALGKSCCFSAQYPRENQPSG